MDNICFQVGQEVIARDCKSKCVCRASGLVVCDDMSCANEEVCDARNGVRACHVKESQCSVSPSGVFTSFDGMTGTINKNVRGAYEVASLCNENAKKWFRVVVDIRQCNTRAPPAVATLYVFFKESVVAVNSEHETWVRIAKNKKKHIYLLIMKVIIFLYFSSQLILLSISFSFSSAFR